jgi:hypothetical protein
MFPFDRNEKSKARELKEKVGTIPEIGNTAHVERTLLSAAFDFA